MGIFKDNWILRNNVVYWNNKGFDFEEEEFVCLNSSFEIDFVKSVIKLIIGDIIFFYSVFINGVCFGGISFGMDYVLCFDYVYWNILSLRGSVVFLLMVDLYIDGVNIY